MSLLARVQKKFGTGNRQLLANLFSLYALQGANYLIPFIVLPHVARALGPGSYGRTGFAASFAGYFVILCDYGFNLSATRGVAIRAGEKGELREYVTQIFTAKLLLLIFSTLLFGGLVEAIPELRATRALLWISYLTVISSTLYPQWLFLGLHQGRFLTATSVLPRALCIPLFFLFVRGPEDLLWAQGLSVGGAFVAALIGFIAARSYLDRRALRQDRILHVFIEGTPLFLSSVSINIYNSSGPFLLGLLSTSTQTGFYTSAMKFIVAVQGLMLPLSQAVYPRLSQIAAHSATDAVARNRRLFPIVLGIGLASFIGLLIMAPFLVALMLGKQYEESIPVLRGLAFVPLLTSLSNLLGVQTMLALGRTTAFGVIVALGSVFYLIFSFVLIPPYGAHGAMLALVLTEIFICLAMYTDLRSKNLNPLRFK